ncbi:MAG: hypothetical protein ACK5IN_04290 [Microbacterium sp.]|uniref:hypothetical protein n=1 Tax=Microbacterium sp. TaxID=51671 RepID=UPI003A8677D2
MRPILPRWRGLSRLLLLCVPLLDVALLAMTTGGLAMCGSAQLTVLPEKITAVTAARGCQSKGESMAIDVDIDALL